MNLTERKTMSELVIKTAKENGDLPKDFDGHSVEKLHKVIDRKIKILEDSNKLQAMTFGDCKIEFKDILNPTKLREWFEKNNGQENKDKENA